MKLEGYIDGFAHSKHRNLPLMFDFTELLRRARAFTEGVPSMEALGRWVFEQDWIQLDWSGALPPWEEKGAYSRNMLAVEPFEVALLRWKPGAESAVHFHQGFWGFVVCLSGQLEHHGFRFEAGRLSMKDRVVAFPGGILAEPDGTIHRLVNGSDSEPLITLHLYAPALEDLGGLRLFDVEGGDVFTLKASAPAAVLGLDPHHYESVEEHAFQYERRVDAATHFITPVVPKPHPRRVTELLSDYYRAQATDYDRLDQADARRREYTQGVNACIAERLHELNGEHPVRRVLDVGCGTGRRALEILQLSSLRYQVLGTDLSPEMRAIAAQRGVEMCDGFWEGTSGLSGLDAITFLYAFSHFATEADRLSALLKLRSALRPGGMLFIDVFNREDPHEWGPQLVEDFDAWYLGQQGYDPGDVFYSRTGSKELAFLHYTNEREMTALLERAGFGQIECTRIGYAHKPGQEVEEGGSLMFYAKNPN